MNNKTVLVTGGARGIGRAISERFIEDDWRVMVHYNRSREEAEELQSRGDVELVGADLSKEEELKKLLTVINKKSPTVLVNNAGVLNQNEADQLDWSDWEWLFNVNFSAATRLTRETARRMKKGAIVNVTSIRGLFYATRPGIADYCASKAALESITRSLAQQYAPDVRINAVAPGFTATDMTAGLDAEIKNTVAEKTPMGRFGNPREIANAVYFLAGEEASFITGETLVVDGGYSISG